MTGDGGDMSLSVSTCCTSTAGLGFSHPPELAWVGLGSSHYLPDYFADEEEINLARTHWIFSSKSHMEDKSSYF